MTFKDVKFDTWAETFAAIRDIFAKETRRHKELLTSGQCDEYSKKTCLLYTSQMWAILEQMRDHATTIVGLVTALTLMYGWFRKPMKQLIAREQQQEEDRCV